MCIHEQNFSFSSALVAADRSCRRPCTCCCQLGWYTCTLGCEYSVLLFLLCSCCCESWGLCHGGQLQLGLAAIAAGLLHLQRWKCMKLALLVYMHDGVSRSVAGLVASLCISCQYKRQVWCAAAITAAAHSPAFYLSVAVCIHECVCLYSCQPVISSCTTGSSLCRYCDQ